MTPVSRRRDCCAACAVLCSHFQPAFGLHCRICWRSGVQLAAHVVHDVVYRAEDCLVAPCSVTAGSHAFCCQTSVDRLSTAVLCALQLAPSILTMLGLRPSLLSGVVAEKTAVRAATLKLREIKPWRRGSRTANVSAWVILRLLLVSEDVCRAHVCSSRWQRLHMQYWQRAMPPLLFGTSCHAMLLRATCCETCAWLLQILPGMQSPSNTSANSFNFTSTVATAASSSGASAPASASTPALAPAPAPSAAVPASALQLLPLAAAVLCLVCSF